MDIAFRLRSIMQENFEVLLINFCLRWLRLNENGASKSTIEFVRSFKILFGSIKYYSIVTESARELDSAKILSLAGLKMFSNLVLAEPRTALGINAIVTVCEKSCNAAKIVSTRIACRNGAEHGSHS